MRRALLRLTGTARDFVRGIDAGHAIRHGAPASGRGRLDPAGRTDPARTGGPYLHWVPDRDGGQRLAGQLVPPGEPERR